MTEEVKCTQLIDDDNCIILDFNIKNLCLGTGYLLELHVYFAREGDYSDEVFIIDDEKTLLFLLVKIMSYCDSHAEERTKYWG